MLNSRSDGVLEYWSNDMELPEQRHSGIKKHFWSKLKSAVWPAKSLF